MKIQPLNNRVVIKRVELETVTEFGLIIPDSAAAKDKPEQGHVIAVGRGKVQADGSIKAPAVKEGDKVLFGKFSGHTVKVDGEELLIVTEDEIVAILTNTF